MPVYQIGSGLPALPNGLEDKDAALVKPIYLSMNALARRVSESTGNVTYSQDEMAALSQLISLTSQKEQTIYVKAAEDLTYGMLLNLYVDTGKIVARKADHTDATKPAHAILDAPLGVLSGAYGPAVFMSGRCAGVTGTIFGAQYFLGLAGAMQNTAPVGVGNFVQPVAVGLGSIGIYLQIPYVAPV